MATNSYAPLLHAVDVDGTGKQPRVMVCSRGELAAVLATHRLAEAADNRRLIALVDQPRSPDALARAGTERA